MLKRMKDLNNSYGIIIQARMTSSRLPGKVLKDILGKPMLQRQIERLTIGTKMPIVVATSNEISDNPIVSLCSELGINCFRGSLNNVVLRFLECAFLLMNWVFTNITSAESSIYS